MDAYVMSQVTGRRRGCIAFEEDKWQEIEFNKLSQRDRIRKKKRQWRMQGNGSNERTIMGKIVQQQRELS